MPLHTDDFANTANAKKGGAKTKNEDQFYHGVDIGKYVDFKAVSKLLKTAVKKVPNSPKGAESWTLTVVVHGDGTGSAWAMDVNPYKTWAW